MRQPGSALRTAATCSLSRAASASPLPFAARIFATTVSTSAMTGPPLYGCAGPPQQAGLPVHAEADEAGRGQQHAGDGERDAVAARRLEQGAGQPGAEGGAGLVHEEDDAEDRP